MGPWLVALGAALWGTESLFRIPLNRALASDVMVFYEHVILVLTLLPLVIWRRHELSQVSARAWLYLTFSGIAGSAVGTVFFTEALKRGNPTVVNVVLNIQPVLSTTLACLLFGDRLASRFFVWAPIAVIAGMFLSIEQGHRFAEELRTYGLGSGTALAFLCALFWGASTVAGRGAMTGMSLGLAAGMRVVIGLVSMAVILLVRGKLSVAALWPATAAEHSFSTVGLLLALSILSGGLPLLLYFEGLRRTRASTAGYFEMMQTLAAVLITWGYFGHALVGHQIIAAAVLIVAVALVQNAQSHVEYGPAAVEA